MGKDDMYCFQCGQQINQTDAYCKYCGSRQAGQLGRQALDKIEGLAHFFEKVGGDYLRLWQGCFDYRGRTRRRVYWRTVAINLPVMLGIDLSLLFLIDAVELEFPLFATLLAWLFFAHVGGTLLSLQSLTIRRLRDAGKSWWCYLLNLVPIIGQIVVASFLCLPEKSA